MTRPVKNKVVHQVSEYLDTVPTVDDQIQYETEIGVLNPVLDDVFFGVCTFILQKVGGPPLG